ncbi:MAG TPA: HU family DNA-binding protein [Rhizomicrobium sp.]
MKIEDLVKTVSGSTGVQADVTKKVIDATLETLGKQMAGEEPVKLQGFGTFMRKPGKEEGKTRVVFRSWPSKDEKLARKKKKLAKKAGAAS